MTLLSKSVVALAAAAPLARAQLFRNGSVIAPCDSAIYCHGEILSQIQLARPFEDSKTFVDMPAKRSLEQIQEAFDELEKPLTNNTALNDFLAANFALAGGELSEVDDLETDAQFLDNINDTVIREFTERVIEIWPDLTRSYTGAGSNCTDCPNSFIPINRTFVVAGGRFREPYYWDSFWILEGLLRTGGSFIEVSRNQIENFLDLVDQYGFVMNGARRYYLNRSQPPLLSQMVRLYVDHTNDTDILGRALPLLIKEHEWWTVNRTVEVSKDDRTYQLNLYNVSNTQPRPESYYEDYTTASNSSYYAESGIIYPETRELNDTEKAFLYANLASGAESGWDYTSRWLSKPNDAVRHVYFPLRSLNIVNIVPVELNSILYWNEVTIAGYLNQTGNETQAAEWTELAANRSEAMYNLMWNDTLSGYFDYNLTSGAQDTFVPADDDTTEVEAAGAPEGQQVYFSVAQFYPFWTGAAPAHIKNNPLAVKTAFERVATYLDTKDGGIPATNLQTGEQWDQPSVWPPLMHILMEGLRNTPATFGESDPHYMEVQGLALRLGQRYLDSTFCTWYATGGSTSDTPQLEGFDEREVGIMFEKYSDNSTNQAGGGGEYEVVEGFGWTNGVLLWVVDTFGNNLTRPDCGDIEAANVQPSKRSAVELHRRDAAWTKKFGSRSAKGKAKRFAKLGGY
ncbi:Trehalase like protein [Verticillium longisporum]|uniref:Alpha,alpha-trehalose glucohydrolase n=1 Tax=Verticillium longisporum TaxID=100787 RepID=A0A8I2Z426_VERLO|nr:Trehalase like protein [Verticillium longisporum]KAG7110869.1 Trehalase like protein [Verticillium longisporum]